MLDLLRPHSIVSCVEELDCRTLIARGVRGVMLDLDNTLTRWQCRTVSPAVQAWVGELWEHGLRACMVTNAGRAHRVRPVAEQLGLPWVVRARKPLAGGFRRGLRLLGTSPEETAMIGDMLFTDVLGGNRLGLLTILVEPLSRHESFLARFLHRPLENLIGRETRRE